MPIKRRDERGRFRKPTDEERWPNPAERERVQRIRSYFNNPLVISEGLRVMAQGIEDMKFISGGAWPTSIRRARHAD